MGQPRLGLLISSPRPFSGYGKGPLPSDAISYSLRRAANFTTDSLDYLWLQEGAKKCAGRVTNPIEAKGLCLRL